MNFSTALDRGRISGLIEGGSFVLLLFVTMPLKYFAGQNRVVSIVGRAHGVLFFAPCAATRQAPVTEDG